MSYLSKMDIETGFVDRSDTDDLGKELAEAYASGDPFPYIVIDNFLPEQVARNCIEEFALSRNEKQTVYDREQERFKREYKPDELSSRTRHLFYAFNSRPFIKIVENITGIKGLIPDPYFLGGGLHEIDNGGRLAVHADFNHHKLMNVERRVNLLIYLNDGWEDAFGGQLELWSNDMKACVHSIVPIFNRAVLFNTTSQSNHGNPTTVANPSGISRKSIALYYYTATWDGTKRSHTTQFRPRAKSQDSTDWAVRRQEVIHEITPPIIRRGFAKIRRMLIAS
jgi:Rps23 Pro-64 3,4-dihydroxylase Tpa1-like proline 4-hydroxylase